MSKKRSKDRKHNGNAKWIRPKGYYCRYEREKGKKAKELEHTRPRTHKAFLTLLSDIYEPRSATGKRMSTP